MAWLTNEDVNSKEIDLGGWKDEDLCYAVATTLIILPLDITQETGQVHTDSLALGEKVEKQNVSSNLQKEKKVDELRQELACFQAKMKLNVRNQRC